MLPKKYRFSLRTQNSRLKKDGQKHYSPFFTLVSANHQEQNIGHPRFCVLLSKKVSPLAVVRNKIKRRSFSALAVILPQLSCQKDFLIIPKKETANLNQEQFNLEIKKLFITNTI